MEEKKEILVNIDIKGKGTIANKTMKINGGDLTIEGLAGAWFWIKSEGCFRIGNNVYIGPGARIFGDIEIADGIAIGANAVVNRSFLEPGITIAGVPARKISDKGSKGLLIACERIKK